MKVLVVAPYFHPRKGGMEVLAYQICKRIAKKHDVVVVTSNHTKKERITEYFDNMKVIRLPIMVKVSNTPVNPFWYFALKKIIKQENPDAIYAHTPVPFLADLIARISPRRTVLHYHNDLIKDNFILDAICRLYYFVVGNQTLKKVRRIIASSKYYAENSEYLKNHLNKITYISPGVDLNHFNTKVKGKRLSEKSLFFLAQLDKTHAHKGLDYLLQAVGVVKSTYPGIHLYVGGNGDNIDYYKSISQKLQIEDNVTFLGFVNEEDLPKYYKSVDITILPTYNRAEGYGMVLAEANACGTPIIGSKIGGIPAVIMDNYNGLLVPPKNVEELAKAIERILSNEKLAKALGSNGAKLAKEKWSWDKIAKETEEALK